MGNPVPAGTMPTVNGQVVDIPFANTPVSDAEAEAIFG